jgi:hypothetical protein
MLSERSDRVWIGTLVDILKYQAQYRSARLDILEDNRDTIRYHLSVTTDPTIYDHPLTLALQEPDTGKIKIFQDGSPVEMQAGVKGTILADLIPKNSLILIEKAASAKPHPGE